MKFERLKRECYIMICGLVAVSSLGASFVAGLKRFEDGLWILPIMYVILFFATGKSGHHMKYSIMTMNIVAYIRYVVLTYMYYLMNDNYTLSNGAVILSYMPEKMSNPMSTTIIMCIEMVVFYACIMAASQFFFREEMDITVLKDKNYGFFALSIAILGILVLIIYPQLIGFYRLISKMDASFLWGAFGILAYVAKVCLIIWMVRYIRGRKRGGEIGSALIVCCLLGVLVIEGAIGLTGLVSRWGFILTAIPCLYLIQKSYPQHFGKIFVLAGVVGIGVMVIMTASRYGLVSAEGEVGFIQRIINYKTFNSYFAGGVNMEIAQRTAETYANQIGFKTIINDILGSCPFVNKLLDNQTDNTVYFFNYTIYNGFIYGDQICPVGGQSILYLGPLGVGILPGIFAILAVWFERQAERSTSLLNKYIYAYCMGVTAIIMCININIWFQFFWQKMLPLLFLVKFDYVKMRFKR